MTFTPGIPLATDFIDESQPVIAANFTELDAVFDVDHYKYSDATGDKGKHRTVTTPAESVHPTTAADEPVLYAYEDYAAAGVLQYSRGGSDAVPTPVTALHGSIASLISGAGNAVTILDLTGMTRFFGQLFIMQDSGVASTACAWYPIFFNGTNIANRLTTGLLPLGYSPQAAPAAQATAKTITELGIQNRFASTITNVQWTLLIHRIE